MSWILRIIIRFAQIGSFLLLGMMFVAGSASAQDAKKEDRKKILIAVDGLSYEAFLQAQKMGMLTEYSNRGVHIAPFPTMTDISWATMTDTVSLFGAAGRIKNVEATFFDESTQSIQGDPRDYYQRFAFPKYYLGAFEALFNPYLEALVYFPTEEVPKIEAKSVVDQILASKNNHITAYIGSVDSTAHTQLNRLYPVIKVLDLELKRMNAAFKARGENPEVILISDHGNPGRFREGQPEQELLPVEISKAIEGAGLKMVQQLKQQSDVAMPLLALGTWGPVYLKDRKNIPKLLQSFRQHEWFDLAMYLNKNDANETRMTVVSSTGDALVHYNKKSKTYTYTPGHGNPLQLHAAYHSSPARTHTMNHEQARLASNATDYPDALFRLVESASNRDFDYPDMIVTLKDGYFIQNSLGGFTKMYRTHGSLSRLSSSGMIASNRSKVPEQIRTKDVFPHIGFDSKKLFGATYIHHNASGAEAVNTVAHGLQKGVETRARDFSDARVFRHLSRFISDTRPYFLVSEMQDFQKAFKANPMQDPSGQGLSPFNFDISKFEMSKILSTDDLGQLTDAVLSAGSTENLINDPRIQTLKEKIETASQLKFPQTTPGQKPGSELGFLDSISEYLLPTKRSVMKLYQLPFLLQNSLVIQEKPFLKEPRDVLFANQWVQSQDGLVQNFKAMTTTPTTQLEKVPEKLFSEIQIENELEDKIYPTPLAKIYNAKMDGVTVVYVPGIYNAIFDQEIFSLGVQALKDELGLRVIQPPVESTCGADHNAEIIKNYLYNDMRSRAERNLPSTRYVFLSYSKGAIDTLHYFTKHPGFVSNYVLGMVAIAAPLQGSSIINKSDLPFDVVNALSSSKGPEICRTDKTAAKSITPAAMNAFWRKNQRSLTGLTRYFSVSFTSTPENSHLFMRATKLIAQFDEDNDGVVPLSSSKFPDGLMALDLGVVEADHLAGILSSNFNQKAFFRSLIATLGELQTQDWKNNFKWNSQIILDTANAGKYFWSKTSLKNLKYTNTWDLNQQLLPRIPDPADSYEPIVKLPSSNFRFDPYSALDIQQMPDVLAATRVDPLIPTKDAGVHIEFNHKNMVHFRMDHQFNYESRSPVGIDDNEKFGFAPAEFNGEKGWLAMRSVKNSMRMTSMAYRFAPTDFSKMSLKIAVTKDVKGADPVIGKTGKDDASFQVWFSIRVGRANGDRGIVDPKSDRVVLFGYYWSAPIAGENRKAGDIYENWYSNKNVVVATLPEAKQLVLNNPDMLGTAQLIKRNFADDLKRAFPNDRVEDMEVISITFQPDSSDTEDSSEAFFKYLSFTP